MNRIQWMQRLVVAATAVTMVGAAAQAQVDLSRYVAIGDSLTAGFQSGGWQSPDQLKSFPLQIFRAATGSTSGFEQPLIAAPGLPGVQALELRSLSPLIIAPKAGAGGPTNVNLARPYNNLGVPGARVGDVLRTTSGGLYDIVLRGAFSPAFAGTTMIQQALAQNPTFVTVWIGNNDVLAAATSGIVVEGVTLTPVAQFDADIKAILTAVAAGGRRVVVANIPRVTSIPYVTTIPPVVVNPATSLPVIVNGQPVPLIGPNGLLRSGDRVLLPASALMAQGIGIPAALGGKGTPLPDSAVLSIEEQQTIQDRLNAFNASINAAASAANVPVADMNAFFDRVGGGVPVGGITFNSSFLTGGLFSYDGVHPSSFGYAIIANEFIRTINARYGSSIPAVNLFPLIFGESASEGPQPYQDFIFTEEAAAQLRQALGVPSDEEIEKARRRLQRRRGRR